MPCIKRKALFMTFSQSSLPFLPQNREAGIEGSYCERLTAVLSQNLDFHGEDSAYASHNFHSFPAKYPPQLPRKFIQALTRPGETVLDPMAGSGTTTLEAYLTGRQGIAFDIDPLALLLNRVKVSRLNKQEVDKTGHHILVSAQDAVRNQARRLKQQFEQRWDEASLQFINYWFTPQTQLELLALLQSIETILDETLRDFFLLTFSATIITKTGGVSLALDLAHTRPHRAKIIYDEQRRITIGQEFLDPANSRQKYISKTVRPAIGEFEKRLQKNIKGIYRPPENGISPLIESGNAQQLPLEDDAIDLIVTSPPYASNAIDYMRAHKFSLVWLGYPIDELGKKRQKYIGGESLANFQFEPLPSFTEGVVRQISALDERKGQVLKRYYSEMTRTLTEMYRVLKPGKTAVVVVGSSVMRGMDTQTANCLAHIGQEIGFEVPKIGVRHLDRNRRMMPAGHRVNKSSQIQQRMHEEYVIGFYKPH